MLGERTFGKDYVLPVERLKHGWQSLIPAGRIEVTRGAGRRPHTRRPIPDTLEARLPSN